MTSSDDVELTSGDGLTSGVDDVDDVIFVEEGGNVERLPSVDVLSAAVEVPTTAPQSRRHWVQPVILGLGLGLDMCGLVNITGSN